MGAIAFFTEEWAIGVENNTHAPADVIRHATPLRVGTIESAGRLLFSEAYAGLDDSNVTVDVTVPAVPHEVIAWIGEIPTIRESGSHPIHRPMALGVYGPALSESLNEVAYVDRDPNSWEAFQPWNTMTWQVMAHIERAWLQALMYNFEDDSKRGATDRAMSWILQGAFHGAEPCLQYASELLQSRDPQALQYREQLLSWRGHGVKALD